MPDVVRVIYKEGAYQNGTFFVLRITEVVSRNKPVAAVQRLYQEHRSVPGGPSADEIYNISHAI